MSKSSLTKFVVLMVALGLAAAACATDSSEEATQAVEEADEATDEAMAEGEEAMEEGDHGGCVAGNINVSGSSTVEPISRRAAELYEPICGDTVITVNGPGTGDGFALFCAGETDVSDASRPIKDTEAATCADNGIEFTELKVAFDGIAVMTNPANDAVSCLSFVDLYALLGGESEGFENWSDANDLAAGLGSDVTPYPAAELVISAPGTESGTYDSFIEIVLEGLAEESQGENAQFVRQDFSGNANDNIIIEGITGADTSLGWVGFAFADENQDRVKTLAIAAEPGGECVEPTTETIADGSYPVSRSLYIYVNNAKVNDNPAIVGYIDHYLGDAYSEAVTEAFGDSGYVELPTDQLDATRAAWEAAKAG